MGDIAEGLINGDFDFETGEYIGNGGGFPKTLNRRYKKNNNLIFNRFKKSKHSPLYGLRRFMSQYGFIKSTDQANYLMIEYAKEFKLKEYESIENLASIIQEDFNKFAKWIKKLNKENNASK